MNIIIPDIDPLIVLFTELPELAKLGCVNKYFYKLVSRQCVVKQWLTIKNTCGRYTSINQIFIEICKNGFLLYGMYIAKKNKININAIDELAFKWSCINGHIEIARWLIHLGESDGYNNKINIHAGVDYAFRRSCENGHIEIALWLIHLGESDGYGKIDPMIVNLYIDAIYKNVCIWDKFY